MIDLQLPLLRKIVEKAPSFSHVLVSIGDALILSEKTLPDLPNSDAICFGLSIYPSVASRHGVFVCSRENP